MTETTVGSITQLSNEKKVDYPDGFLVEDKSAEAEKAALVEERLSALPDKRRHKRGHKVSDVHVVQAMQAIRDGATVKEAAKAVGISSDTGLYVRIGRWALDHAAI